MSYLAFPTGAELLEFLSTADLLPEGYAQQPAALSNAQGAVRSAVDGFEADTGFRPFLAASEDSERRFNAPGPRQPERSYTALLSASLGGGRLLDLGGGLVGEPSSITIDERTVEPGEYWLLPENSDAQGEPWTQLKFTRPIYSQPRGIVITGRWGYCATGPGQGGIPARAYQAVLQGAAALIFYALPGNPSLQSVVRDGLSESFEIASTMTPGQRGEALIKTYTDAVKQFRRGV